MHVHDLALAQRSAGMSPVVVERGSREFADRLRNAGIDVVSATGHGFWAGARILARQIAERRPDIVHAHGYDADYWAAATRWRYGRVFRDRRLVFTQHGVVEDTIWHKCKTLVDAACMRVADGVITCAPGLVGRMESWCPTGVVTYIPNGVRAPEAPTREAARRSLGLAQDKFVLAYVGRLSPEKRPDRIITLIADARKAGKQVSALVVGSGPLRTALEQQVDTLGVRDSIRFAGFTLDMGDVYGAVDALVLLSDTEATSRVVIEAMATGVPVIASSVGGVPELLDSGQAGWLVPPGDRNAAVMALSELLKQRERFIGVAKQRASEYYLADVMNRRVTEFYEEILATRTRGCIARLADVSDEG